MKVLFSFYFFFSSFTMFSQNSLNEIFKFLSTNNNEVKIAISKNKKDKYIIGKSNLNELGEKKIFELIVNDSKRFSLIPLANNDNYIVYTLLPNDILNTELNIVNHGIFNTFLLYDVKNKKLLSIETNYPGYIYKTKRSNIILGYSFSDIRDFIYELDSDLKPVSAISFSEEKGIIYKNLFLCSYNMGKLSVKKNKFESKDSSIFFMPFNNLIAALAEKPKEYDTIVEFEDNYHFSNIFLYLDLKYY